MNFVEWEPIYKRILNDFNFDRKMDYYSSIQLSKILSKNPGNLEDLRIFAGKNSNVIGNGPNLERILGMIPKGINIVADSAISTYYMVLGCPDAIVSDLDGDVELIKKCQNEGSKIVLHAHGDNVDKIMKYGKLFLPDFIGTTQNYPLFNVHNFGGFTDGDRAACLMDHLKSPKITLVGFDFQSPGFKESGDRAAKLKKLAWAKEILTVLSRKRNSKFAEGNIVTI